MLEGTVKRWHPPQDLAERPVSLFDLTWQGSKMRLLATVEFATDAGEGETGSDAILVFENVFAFQVFEESMELTRLTGNDAALLRQPYPYGGVWPFFEIHDSQWIDQLVECDGGWNASSFRHFIISARNMHVHVATMASTEPTFYLSA